MSTVNTPLNCVWNLWGVAQGGRHLLELLLAWGKSNPRASKALRKAGGISLPCSGTANPHS